MTPAVNTLPDDPETLKAMLIAERIRSERLVQCQRRRDFPHLWRPKIPQSGGLAISHERDWRLRFWVGVRVA